MHRKQDTIEDIIDSLEDVQRMESMQDKMEVMKKLTDGIMNCFASMMEHMEGGGSIMARVTKIMADGMTNPPLPEEFSFQDGYKFKLTQERGDFKFIPEDPEASDEISKHRGLVVAGITDHGAEKDLSGMTSDFQTAGANWKIRFSMKEEFKLDVAEIIHHLNAEGMQVPLEDLIGAKKCLLPPIIIKDEIYPYMRSLLAGAEEQRIKADDAMKCALSVIREDMPDLPMSAPETAIILGKLAWLLSPERITRIAQCLKDPIIDDIMVSMRELKTKERINEIDVDTLKRGFTVMLPQAVWDKCMEVPPGDHTTYTASITGPEYDLEKRKILWNDFKLTISHGDERSELRFTVDDADRDMLIQSRHFPGRDREDPLLLSEFINSFKEDHRTIRSNKTFDAN